MYDSNCSDYFLLTYYPRAFQELKLLNMAILSLISSLFQISMSAFKILTTAVRPVLFAITPMDHSAALVNPVSLEMDTTAHVHFSAGGGPSLEHI